MWSRGDRKSWFFAGCLGLRKVHGRRKARILAVFPSPQDFGTRRYVETGSRHSEIEGIVSLRFGLVCMISS